MTCLVLEKLEAASPEVAALPTAALCKLVQLERAELFRFFFDERLALASSVGREYTSWCSRPVLAVGTCRCDWWFHPLVNGETDEEFCDQMLFCG